MKILGELYPPSGLALETARAVLEVDYPHAVNVALGCPNGCLYCYGAAASRQSRENYLKPRFPKEDPSCLVGRQLEKGLKVEGAFMSFLTDPYLPELRMVTENLASFLLHKGIPRVATLSKLDVSYIQGVRSGMTIVSPYEEFSKKYEPNVPPPSERLKKLWSLQNIGGWTWVSMEPWPVQAMYPYRWRDIEDFWGQLSDVDLIVFGKWNYDKRARTEVARQEYMETVEALRHFCRKNNIQLHVKSDTLKFIGYL